MHHFNNLIEHFGYFGIFIALVGGILAGINGYSIKRFSLFAFTGVALWCITFITLGNFLGPQWKIVHNYVSKYGMYIFALGIFVVVIVSIIFWQKRGEQKKVFYKEQNGRALLLLFSGTFNV